MMIFPRSKFLREIEDRMDDRRKALSRGASDNMKEYGEACGFIQGLESASNIFEDVWEEYKKQVQSEEVE